MTYESPERYFLRRRPGNWLFYLLPTNHRARVLINNSAVYFAKTGLGSSITLKLLITMASHRSITSSTLVGIEQVQSLVSNAKMT
jgi:hypothetical protein